MNVNGSTFTVFGYGSVAQLGGKKTPKYLNPINFTIVFPLRLSAVLTVLSANTSTVIHRVLCKIIQVQDIHTK